MRLKSELHYIWRFLQRENLHRLLYIIGILTAFGTVSITLLEPEISLLNGFWWTIVTLTTVGYGDISPITLGGRIIAIIMMFFGIGLLGLFSATIASVLVDKKIKEDRGMSSYRIEDHIILCEWNHLAWVILDEFRADPQTAEAPIILIANIERKPIDDKNLFFIQGNVSDETLRRANLARAQTVVILGDDHLDHIARDGKVVLTTLTVESINPNVYTVVELVDEIHVQYCERAHADEIIVSSELTSGLIARAALNHGVSKVITELLSSGHGNELYKTPAPASIIGRQFIEVLKDVKRRYQSVVLAIQKGNEGKVITNPAEDYRLEDGDYLLVVAEERPKIL